MLTFLSGRIRVYFQVIKRILTRVPFRFRSIVAWILVQNQIGKWAMTLVLFPRARIVLHLHVEKRKPSRMLFLLGILGRIFGASHIFNWVLSGMIFQRGWSQVDFHLWNRVLLRMIFLIGSVLLDFDIWKRVLSRMILFNRRTGVIFYSRMAIFSFVMSRARRMSCRSNVLSIGRRSSCRSNFL